MGAPKIIQKPTQVKRVRPTDANIYNTIKIETQLFRVRQDIGKLRVAILIAENIQRPQRYQLYQAYIDAYLDSHLSACWNNRVNFTLGRVHQWINADGSVNEEMTELLIHTKWFRDWIKLSLDSQLWGYSVIQFGDVTNSGFTSATLVPRIYVKPEFGLVTTNYSSYDGNAYNEEPFKYWCMGVGDAKDLGLLKQASFHAIYKKNALGAWAEFCEVFGMPLRIGYTDMLDPIARQNMENALKNMAVSSYAMLQKNSNIEYKESTRSDAFKVYQEMVSVANFEMSKLILGATGLMDEKAHVGSADVHKQIADNIMYSDEMFIENLVNNQLKEILCYHGFPVGNLTYKISDVEDIDLATRGKLTTDLLNTGKYFIQAEYIEKTFGIPCEKVEEPDEPKINKNKAFEKSVRNDLAYLYP